MAHWPGSEGLQLTLTSSLEDGASANVSRLQCDVHIGTHVDAPRHFLKQGSTIDRLPLPVLIGPATVAHLPDVREVTPDDLNRLELPIGTKRLLLRTINSERWSERSTELETDYVALTEEAATWIVKRGIRLIGIDSLSVQRYTDSSATHRILLEAEVVIVEGLNLAGVEPGEYELICLPICLVGSEGAPARAVLRRIPNTQEHP